MRAAGRVPAEDWLRLRDLTSWPSVQAWVGRALPCAQLPVARVPQQNACVHRPAPVASPSALSSMVMST